MFDFESDQVDPRFAAGGESAAGDPSPKPPPSLVPPAISRQAPNPIPAPPLAIPIPPPIPARAAPPRSPEPRQWRTERRLRVSDWVWFGIAAALIPTFVVLGLALAAVINASKQIAPAPPTPITALPTPVDARLRYDQPQAAVTSEPTLVDSSGIVLQPWDGTSRLNVLLMGIDRRNGESGLAYRSDTMMLISFDPASKQLGILSIPRDLYVPVPGYSERQRINSALPLGEEQRAGFGPTLAMQTVQVNMGMGVNAYVIVDFIAVTRLVDAIGGIDIDVPEAIADYDFPDMGYGYDPLILQAGLQHMDGDTAQKYARTRHGDSDFDRARRQQQVLFAIRERLLSLNTLPQLIAQAPSLYASLSQNIYTDLSLDQILELGLWLKDLPTSSIHTGVIDQHYVTNYTTPDGAEVLVPYPDAIPSLLEQVFGSDYNQ